MNRSHLLFPAPETSAVPFSRRTASLVPSSIREILKATESPEVVSFAGGLPAPELFPGEDIAAALDHVLRTASGSALQYGVTEGHAPLRSWIAEYTRQTTGLWTDSRSILVTHGSQQGLDLLAKVLLDPGDTVLTEDPAYLGALQVFRMYEARVVGLPTDRDGLLPDALATYLRHTSVRPKFLYLTPTFQNPTGSCLPPGRRAALAEIAETYGLWIVEDDPYHALRYTGAVSRAVAADLSHPRWVYLGSASKILAPGLRIGWLVTPERSLHEKLVAAKQATDLHTGTLAQRAFHQLVQDHGWLRTHVAMLVKVYSRRRDTLLRALRRHFAGRASWNEPAGGLFVWLTLEAEIDSRRLLARAVEHDVVFVPGDAFWVHEPRLNTLRLNFSHPSEERIELGVERLAQALTHLA